MRKRKGGNRGMDDAGRNKTEIRAKILMKRELRVKKSFQRKNTQILKEITTTDTVCADMR